MTACSLSRNKLGTTKANVNHNNSKITRESVAFWWISTDILLVLISFFSPFFQMICLTSILSSVVGSEGDCTMYQCSKHINACVCLCCCKVLKRKTAEGSRELITFQFDVRAFALISTIKCLSVCALVHYFDYSLAYVHSFFS